MSIVGGQSYLEVKEPSRLVLNSERKGVWSAWSWSW